MTPDHIVGEIEVLWRFDRDGGHRLRGESLT
jgi:hypothetical protein